MNTTVVIVNYQTPELLNNAVNSFKQFYSSSYLLIVDNGSKDEGASEKVIQELCSAYKKTEAVFLESNIYHGPAMDLVIKNHVDSEFTFFLDSDTETKASGFLERMEEIISSDEKIYGVGEITKSNKRGYKSENGEEILLTPYMLIKNDIYRSLEPFIHHGQPTLRNFQDAREKGYCLEYFEVSKYIDHLWRGTASKFGYGLGIKGKIDFILNKLGV